MQASISSEIIILLEKSWAQKGIFGVRGQILFVTKLSLSFKRGDIFSVGPVLFSFCFFQGHVQKEWDKVWNQKYPFWLSLLDCDWSTWHEMCYVYFWM